ncbi:unnamed protein product, partial [Laminaria digitata]
SQCGIFIKLFPFLNLSYNLCVRTTVTSIPVTMSFVGDGPQQLLLLGVYDGEVDDVTAALEAGANVNGTPEHPYAPIVVAAMGDHASMIVFLLEQGADPDLPATEKVPHLCPISDTDTATPGERALHVAARNGYIEIVNLLLKRARADPNATDDRGYTPLMACCSREDVCVGSARLLLEAGGDPALAQEQGFIPLHFVA